MNINSYFRRDGLFILGIAVLSALLVICAYFFLKIHSHSLKEQAAYVEKNIATFGPVAQKLRHQKAEQNSLENRTRAISELKNKTSSVLRVLDKVAFNIPKEAWLSEIAASDSSITLKGWATNNELISTFMRSLREALSGFSIELRYTQADTYQKRSLYRFEIICEEGEVHA